MKTDIQIANEAVMEPIVKIAQQLNISEDDLELYGKYKAKLSDNLWDKIKDNPNGKLVLVTAINPTPAGEGKTTITVGLGQAINKLGLSSIITLREPSLGPCMGIKGGAAGGGYSQVVPMEDINLHFTGDIHAVSSAHNLLSALIDNHLHQGNVLGIDQRSILWKRVIDMNDRVLRHIVVGLGGKNQGIPREDGFMIAVASEVMAILCLSEDIEDLKRRLGEMLIAYSYEGKPINVKDLKADGAMAVLLKDAIKPNLVQTLENTPVIMHGGPFANIAHGCNSVIATRYALKLSDIVITEAGFGADLGAEKFFDIKCRKAGLKPDAVVLVATIRALKYNGGVAKSHLDQPDTDAVKDGFVNLEKHIENLRLFGVPIVVTLNTFLHDSEEEIEFVKNACEALGCEFALAEVWKHGGYGGVDLAKKVVEAVNNVESNFTYLYNETDSIKEKINIIATKIYGAKGVKYSHKANKAIHRIEDMGKGGLPICIAKTQYSLSDQPKLIGRPTDFEINVSEIKLSAGAGFIVAITGDIMVMPGLPKIPAAESINIDKHGIVSGLF